MGKTTTGTGWLTAFDTALANYNYTQALTFACWHKAPSATGGSLFSKRDGVSPFKGLDFFARTGTTGPQYAVEMCNTTVTPLRCAVRTTSDFAFGCHYRFAQCGGRQHAAG